MHLTAFLLRIVLTLLVWIGGVITNAEDIFRVVDISPGNKTRDVELEPLIQIHVSESFDASTVNRESVRLLRFPNRQLVPISVAGDLGGVLTVSVEQRLQVATQYELQVTSAIKSRQGDALEPLSVRFQTTSQPPKRPRADIADFRFAKRRLDRRDGVCGLAIHHDSLFACTWDGKLIRYSLGADGVIVEAPRLLLSRKRRFNAIVPDPRSTTERVVLWLSHDSQHELSLGPNDFSGTITRVEIDATGQEPTVALTDVIIGLPTGDHPASGLTFGPEGRLFVSQGALSMLGGKPEVPETPLSAATLAIDVENPILQTSLPLDVRDFRAATDSELVQVFRDGYPRSI